MRLSQASFTMMIFILLLASYFLVYYRGLVADLHAVGQEADNTLSLLQLRGQHYAT